MVSRFHIAVPPRRRGRGVPLGPAIDSPAPALKMPATVRCTSNSTLVAILFNRPLNVLRKIKHPRFKDVAEERQCFGDEATLFR